MSILLGRAQPVIPPNLYSNVNEHNSLGSPGNVNYAYVGADYISAKKVHSI